MAGAATSGTGLAPRRCPMIWIHRATAIASWSARARPGAPVAATLAWDDLESKEQPLILLRDAPLRLQGPEPWADFEASRRPITKSMLERMAALSKQSPR